MIDRARENGKSIECNWESFRGREIENLQNANVDASPPLTPQDHAKR